VKEVVQGAFAHRRKTLMNSLELARGGRSDAETAVAKLGLPANVRAEALAPGQFLELADLLP
jgi:16S rRNA A1518/A1519 N6-dimethyltransferase RsmA/KsgA/DIM1 with predicted DNA glycosylase/AP lyase activity